MDMSSLIVAKFGGTSVGSMRCIKRCAQVVAKLKAEGHDVVVVTSAMAGVTSRLYEHFDKLEKRTHTLNEMIKG